MSVYRRNSDPLEQLDRGVNDALTDHTIRHREWLTKLQDQVDRLPADLRQEFTSTMDSIRQDMNSAREEQSRRASELETRFSELEGKLVSAIESALDGKGKRTKEEETITRVDGVPPGPRTIVDEALPPAPTKDELSQLSHEPTRINPPDMPRGMRGRRHARRAKTREHPEE